jgi:hypothetical protein
LQNDRRRRRRRRRSLIKNRNIEGSNEWSGKSEMACRQDMGVDGAFLAEGLVFRALLMHCRICPVHSF